MDNGIVMLGLPMMIFSIIVAIFLIIVMWKVLTKAGLPGWAIFIPIYNIIVFLQLAGKPWWWIFLMFIPIANIIVAILIPIGVAHKFGKSTGFGLGLLFLGIIFYPILAFGDAQYQK